MIYEEIWKETVVVWDDIQCFLKGLRKTKKHNWVRFYRFPVESRVRQFQNASGEYYCLNQHYGSLIIVKYALKRKAKTEGFGLLVLLQI